MTNKDVANLIFKDITKTIEDYNNIYPERNLPSGTIVTRYAPSPTGFIHMGNIYASYVERKMAKQTNGIFYLRIEDTDQKRTVEDGIPRILNDLKSYNIEFDEYPLNMDEEIGNYGPYIQSKREDIYKTFIKYFIEKGLAYPCFCSEEELSSVREEQEKNKDRIGYYGKFAKCRNLSVEEQLEKLNNGEKYIIRIKSPGDFNNRIVFKDLVMDEVEMPENDLDIVILKGDGLPTYHFAHLVDDYLMKTTHVIRDQNWLPSLPIHIQLFEMLGVTPPEYAHIAPLMKNDNGSIRKLSKRKDPEAAASYYYEKGIPVEAVMIYIATISNSNFEMWFEENKDKDIEEFNLTFDKLSKSGPLFDIEKIENISKNYLSTLTAKEIYNNLLNWAEEFDKEFAELLKNNKDYSISILNIERDQEKPRKDFSCYSEIKDLIWYMYDEFFDNSIEYEFTKIEDKNEIALILKVYLEKYFDINDTKEEWFNKVKLLSDELGYASNMKEYKNNPENYKGNVADISMVLRVALTSKTKTPDLYQMIEILGKDRVINRFNIFIK